MKFRSLLIKNIFRNKTRSLLAILGIAIGVATILGLGLVTNGLAASTQQALTADAADFTVIAGTTGGGGSPDGASGGGAPGGQGGQQLINQTKVSEIQQISGVQTAAGVLRTNVNLNDTSSSTNSTTTTSSSASGSSGNMGQGQGNFQMMYSVIGIDSSNLGLDDIVITNGTAFSNDNQVIMGDMAAQSLNKTVGDTITLSNQTFTIVGTYETGNFQDDRGIVMSLGKLQSLTGNTDMVSLILVKAANGTSSSTLADTIESKYPNELSTSTSLSGMERMNNGLEIIESGAWAVTLLALLIGGIVVVVTMVKSVVERTREIGVLKAVGWTNKRILAMIIGESVVLSLLAAVVGIIVGVGVVEIISSAHLIMGVEPAFSAGLFLEALAVAIFLGIVGGIYPAYRASRLSPTEALRYE
ncbi:MAG: ABC-type transport system, involved in lipoprotein release, permease component [Methanobacterium sp. Maddingley MBC34]|nr:MAG: ABC-type transport system, involved in lipoprotein release, permease component [Methanobacterium sp. Maddingley MBC34]